jgi:peptidoglycan-associated lipoprotein
MALAPRSALLAFSVLAVLTSGCKKKVPPTPEPEPTPPPAAAPEVELGIVSISPSTVAPNTATNGTIRGSGFEAGVSVSFGGTAATQVSFQGSNSLSVGIPALAVGTYDVTVRNPDGATSTLRSALTVKSNLSACSQFTVRFDFDSSSINSDANSLLSGKAACLQSGASRVRIEGHADERGTTDYNLALGQRRADAVKSFLATAGVSASRIETMSFGEESPANSGQDEAAWAENRRAELKASE